MITAAVGEQGAATREIAGSVHQAARSTQEVAQNVSGTIQTAEEMNSVASRVLSGTANLSKQSEHLKREIGGFLAVVRAS